MARPRNDPTARQPRLHSNLKNSAVHLDKPYFCFLVDDRKQCTTGSPARIACPQTALAGSHKSPPVTRLVAIGDTVALNVHRTSCSSCRMTASVSRTVNKGTADVGTYARSLSADPSGIATAIAECARVTISSPADLRTKAVAVLNIALESSPPACKTLAVFSRRLHDRYPRFKADNGSSVTFASVMFHACQAELSSLHDSVQQFGDEMSNENVPEEVNSLRQPRSSPSNAESISNTEQAKVDLCTSHAASITCLRHLDALQIFIACLYTQDVVPEDFVHKILDSHRFSSLSWPPPARHVGLMSACDMMTFCGKRLETLGSLCHVMPDWYSYLRSLQQDLSIPRQVHDRIAFIIKLRENQWVPESVAVS